MFRKKVVNTQGTMFSKHQSRKKETSKIAEEKGKDREEEKTIGKNKYLNTSQKALIDPSCIYQ